MKPIIVVGNQNQEKEIKNFIENAKYEAIEIQELYANNPITSILHKADTAKEALEKDVIVEDITMYVNNQFVQKIEGKQNELKDGDKVEFILTIAKTKNNKIEIHQKVLKGIIHLNKCDKYDFDFDNIIFVNNEKCLGDYKKEKPLRDIYYEIYGNMRKPDYVFDIKDIKK